MPTAPVYGNQNAQSRVVPGVFKQPNRTAADYGATDALGKMAQVAENVYIKESDQRAEDAANTANFQKQEAATRIKAENPGVKAVGADALIRDAFAKIDNETLSGLQGNPRAVASYQKSAKLTDAAMQPQITGWMLSERDKAATATDKAAFERYTSEAARLAPMSTVDLVSGVAYMAAMAQAKMAQMSLLNRVGASKETIEQANSELDGKVNAQVVASFIDIQDFSKASAWFKSTKHLMDPATASKLEGDIIRGSTKNVGEAYAVNVFTDLLKKNQRYPNMLAGQEAILNNPNMNESQKVVALNVLNNMGNNHRAAYNATSASLAQDTIKEIEVARKVSIAKGAGSAVPKVLQDIMASPQWANLEPDDRKAVEYACLYPPDQAAQSAFVNYFKKEQDEGRIPNSLAYVSLTPENREYLEQRGASLKNDTLAKQYSQTDNVMSKTRELYEKSLGKKPGEYSKYEAKMMTRLQANPDLANEMLKNTSKAMQEWKAVVDAGETAIPSINITTPERNNEVIRQAIAADDFDALRQYANATISWSGAYSTPERRNSIVGSNMAIIAQSSGKKWEDWQKLARVSFNDVPQAPQVIDSRANDLMWAAIDDNRRAAINTETINSVLDSKWNPVTGPMNPFGNVLKHVARWELEKAGSIKAYLDKRYAEFDAADAEEARIRAAVEQGRANDR